MSKIVITIEDDYENNCVTYKSECGHYDINGGKESPAITVASHLIDILQKEFGEKKDD